MHHVAHTRSRPVHIRVTPRAFFAVKNSLGQYRCAIMAGSSIHDIEASSNGKKSKNQPRSLVEEMLSEYPPTSFFEGRRKPTTTVPIASENNVNGKDEHKDDAGSDSEDEKKLQKGNYLTLAPSRSVDSAGLTRGDHSHRRRVQSCDRGQDAIKRSRHVLTETQIRRLQSWRILFEPPKTSRTLLPPVPSLPNEPSLPTWFSGSVPSYDSTALFSPLSSLPLNGPITGSLTSVQIKAPRLLRYVYVHVYNL